MDGMIKRVLRVLGIGLVILRRDGLLKFMIAALGYVDRRRSRFDGLPLVRRRIRFDPPVFRDDILNADFVSHPYDRVGTRTSSDSSTTLPTPDTPTTSICTAPTTR